MNTLKVLLFVIAYLLIGCSSFRELSAEQESARRKIVDDLLLQGVLSLRAGDSDSARSSFSAAQDVGLLDARVYDALGCVEFASRNYELAKTYFLHSIKLNPNYDRPYVHLAAIAEVSNNNEGAVELYTYALSLNPQNYRARNNLAILLGKNNKNKKIANFELRKAAHFAGFPDKVLQGNLEARGLKTTGY